MSLWKISLVEKQEEDLADFNIFMAFPVTFGPQ